MIRKIINEHHESQPHAYFIIGAPGSGKSTYANKLIQKLGLKHSDVFIQDDDVEYEKYSGLNGKIEDWMIDEADKRILANLDKYISNGGRTYINVNLANVSPRYVASIAEVLCEHFDYVVEIIVIDCPLRTCLDNRTVRNNNQRFIDYRVVEEAWDVVNDIVLDKGKSYCNELSKLIYSDIDFNIVKR